MRFAALVVPLLVATPVAAAITDVHIHGFGMVTYSNPDIEQGIYGPPVGLPVEVIGDFHLGTAEGGPDPDFLPAPPDGFTGHYEARPDAIFFHYTYYSWSVSGAGGASSFDQAQEYASADFDFVDGVLTGFSLDYIGDPDGHSIGAIGRSGGFSEDLGYYSPANWGGTFTLDAQPSAAPEPASWALMIAGFAMVGTARRRQAVRCG